MIRVLVCDDSVVIRQVVTDALKGDPGIQVVGVAQNGRVALEKIPDCQPDVMTLDLEMPEMDGLTTLTELRKRKSQLPVVVFSTLTERGASITMDALARGASDYVCKPSGQRNLQQTMETIRAELIPKIYALSNKSRGAAPRPLPPIKAPAGPFPPVNLIVIGVSTGGPGALQEVIPRLPAGLQQPVLIVQHMPPVFTKVLAQRLGQASPLKVKEAEHQERLTPGQVLIAPGNFHMRIAGSPRDAWVTLDQNPQENGCRPAVDPLFVSASQVFGGAVLALVMTGLGRDGTKGAGAVRKAHGQVWVQDEASSTVWGMPGSVVEAGLALRVIPLQNIARAIGEIARTGGGAAGSAKAPGAQSEAVNNEHPDLDYVTQLVLDKAAIKLTSAQEYLVKSRLEPLAKQQGLADLAALVEKLRSQPYGELHAQVIEAMTTNETSFFRDVHPFETLRNLILPELLTRKTDRTLRIWSAACSTGQEPYSLAMLCADMPKLKDYRVQILATDLSRATLGRAQRGCYTALEVGRGLPARALAQHFDRAGTSFQVKSSLRSMIEWKHLNLASRWLTMPMFDVVFMRNVLIYFPPATVETVLRQVRSHTASHGYLFLGTTENMLGLNTGFESVSFGKTIVYRPSGAKR